MGSRGRRRGGSAREHIVAAARALFAERGFDGTSMRAVARAAEVDPGLVRYYFPDGKAGLFVAAFAAQGERIGARLERVLEGEPERVAERLLTEILELWDAPGGPERFRALFSAAAAGEARMVREFLAHALLSGLARAVPGPDADDRVALVASQVAGVLVARYVLQLEPLASMPGPELAARVGPVAQRYLDPEELRSTRVPGHSAAAALPPDAAAPPAATPLAPPPAAGIDSSHGE